MKKFINTMSVLILAFVVIILMLSSCRTSGYGCKGNYSWDRMVKKNNRFY